MILIKLLKLFTDNELVEILKELKVKIVSKGIDVEVKLIKDEVEVKNFIENINNILKTNCRLNNFS